MIKWEKQPGQYYEGFLGQYIVYMWNSPDEMAVFSERSPRDVKIKFIFKCKKSQH